MNDYIYGHLYDARMAELHEIAAMDRLAAQVAPPSALRRYAESRAASGQPSAPRWADRLRRVLRHGVA